MPATSQVRLAALGEVVDGAAHQVGRAQRCQRRDHHQQQRDQHGFFIGRHVPQQADQLVFVKRTLNRLVV
jgi:hypothetical protein